MRAQRWIHRRVDTLEFTDTDSVHLNCSIDLTPPTNAPTFILPSRRESFTILPVLQVRKQPLVNFDLCDESGAAIPHLTARQSRTLAARGMLELGDLILREMGLPHGISRALLGGEEDEYDPLVDRRVDLTLPISQPDPARTAIRRAHREVQRMVIDLVAGDSELGAAALAWFESADGTEVPTSADAYGATLWKSTAYKVFLRRLAAHYFLSVVLATSPDIQGRRVIRASFDLPRDESHLYNKTPMRGRGFRSWSKLVARPLVRDMFEVLALSPVSVAMNASQAVDAESYHVEFVAPHGLKIIDADWFIGPPPAKGTGESPAERVRRELGEKPVSVSPDIRARDVEPDRVNTAIVSVPLFYTVYLRWRLAPSALSWISMATPVAFVATALHGIFVLGVTRAHSMASWVPQWISDEAGWALGGAESGVTTHGTELAGSLAQNRTALILAVIAVAVALLVRSGEPAITKRVLIGPRVFVTAIICFLIVAAAPLWVAPETLSGLAAPIVSIGTATLVPSVCLLAFVTFAWLTAVGIWRRPRRHLHSKRSASMGHYWRLV